MTMTIRTSLLAAFSLFASLSSIACAGDATEDSSGAGSAISGSPSGAAAGVDTDAAKAKAASAASLRALARKSLLSEYARASNTSISPADRSSYSCAATDAKTTGYLWTVDVHPAEGGPGINPLYNAISGYSSEENFLVLQDDHADAKSTVTFYAPAFEGFSGSLCSKTNAFVGLKVATCTDVDTTSLDASKCTFE